MTGGKATKHIVETIAKVIFLICAAVAIVAVLSITVYMFAKGTPGTGKGRGDRPVIWNCMAADSSNTILWYFIYYSDFYCRYCSGNSDRCTDWNSDSGIYHRGFQ